MSNSLVAAHQPNFMPNIGFFHKMSQVDKFILITNLQFEKQEGWQQRNKFPNTNSPETDLWLTVPVRGSQNDLFKEVLIDNTKNWAKKHKKTLQQMYSKTLEKEFLNKLLEVYDSNPERLVDLNTSIIKLIHSYLNMQNELVIDEEVSGIKHELLINICRKYNAGAYLSGKGALNYMDESYLNELEKNNVENKIIENFPQGFPHSIVHYILSLGKEKVNELIGNSQIAKEAISLPIAK